MTEDRAQILVINDDTTFLQLMHDLLQCEEGYAVTTYTAADGAYERVKAAHPDLVILDIRVGHEEQGWTVLELLTLDPETLPIPVIVCSAAISTLQEHAAILREYDCEILAKPFDLDALLTMVRRVLAEERRRPHQ